MKKRSLLAHLKKHLCLQSGRYFVSNKSPHKRASFKFLFEINNAHMTSSDEDKIAEFFNTFEST